MLVKDKNSSELYIGAHRMKEKDIDRIIAKTANVEIIERKRADGVTWYIFSLYGGKYWNVFHTKHETFQAAYDELKAIPFC